MYRDFKDLLPDDFPNDAKVWIYQSSRLFILAEALEIEAMLKDFTSNWQSHSQQVRGYANLFFGQFILLMADEAVNGVGGCSIDSSVRFIKEIEARFNVSFFNRQTLAFIIKDKVELLPLPQLKYAYENKFITGETLYFNNTILTKGELMNQWIIPVKESWLAGKLPLQSPGSEGK